MQKLKTKPKLKIWKTIPPDKKLNENTTEQNLQENEQQNNLRLLLKCAKVLKAAGNWKKN